MKKSRKWIAVFLASAMVFTTLIGSAFAADVRDVYKDNAPEAVKTDMSTGTILSGATAAANTTELNVLGINVTSTDSAGALNSASDASAPLDLLVFGSDLNEAPDPYLYNFYYNLAKNQFDLPDTQYNIDDYAGWSGAYTLLNYAKDGPTGSADTDEKAREISIGINGANETSNPLFYYKPDLLFGATKGSYDLGLSVYNADKTTLYSPLVIDGWTTQGDALNDGTFKSTYTMANAVYDDALEIQSAGLGKDSRYGNVVDCGVDYENFMLGFYFYAQKMFESGDLNKLKYCSALTVDTWQDTYYTVYYIATASNFNRYGQYLDGIAELVEPDGVMYYDTSSLKKAVDVVFTSELTANQVTMMNHVGINVVDTTKMPSTVYGMTMQSADNALGVPYFFAKLYSDQLAAKNVKLSEYDVVAYFVEHIYHVKADKVLTVMKAMYPEGTDFSDFHQDTYNDVIEDILAQGAEYYFDNLDGSGIWKAADDGRI